jgi:hypothetical protein
LISQPRSTASFDRCDWPVVKNSARRGSSSPFSKMMRSAGAAAVDRDRLIADFPAVAIRTMEHAPPVQLPDAVDLRKVVADPGGDEQLAGPHGLAVGKRDLESRIGLAFDGRHPDVSQLDRLVAFELAAADRPKLLRIDPVARQVAVQGLRGGVARVAGVTHQHRPPASAEHERRAQPGRSGPDNHDVVRLRHVFP